MHNSINIYEITSGKITEKELRDLHGYIIRENVRCFGRVNNTFEMNEGKLRELARGNEHKELSVKQLTNCYSPVESVGAMSNCIIFKDMHYGLPTYNVLEYSKSNNLTLIDSKMKAILSYTDSQLYYTDDEEVIYNAAGGGHGTRLVDYTFFFTTDLEENDKEFSINDSNESVNDNYVGQAITKVDCKHAREIKGLIIEKEHIINLNAFNGYILRVTFDITGNQTFIQQLIPGSPPAAHLTTPNLKKFFIKHILNINIEEDDDISINDAITLHYLNYFQQRIWLHEKHLTSINYPVTTPVVYRRIFGYVKKNINLTTEKLFIDMRLASNMYDDTYYESAAHYLNLLVSFASVLPKLLRQTISAFLSDVKHNKIYKSDVYLQLFSSVRDEEAQHLNTKVFSSQPNPGYSPTVNIGDNIKKRTLTPTIYDKNYNQKMVEAGVIKKIRKKKNKIKKKFTEKSEKTKKCNNTNTKKCDNTNTKKCNNTKKCDNTNTKKCDNTNTKKCNNTNTKKCNNMKKCNNTNMKKCNNTNTKKCDNTNTKKCNNTNTKKCDNTNTKKCDNTNTKKCENTNTKKCTNTKKSKNVN